MTIAKGQPWGEEIPRPDGLPTASSDAELADLVSEYGAGPFGVTGGDLYAFLGRPDPDRARARRLPMDVVRVRTDRGEHLVVAHAVMRQSWLRGPIVAVANISRIGVWDAVPSAHPNDGRFETVEVDASMPVRQRLVARRRLRTGTHLPHPAIRLRHRRDASFSFARPVRCHLDGVARGTITNMDVSIEADAFAVIV